MRAIIFGSNSDIAKNLVHRLSLDGWEVDGVRGDSWDLFICAVGTLKPIGSFEYSDAAEWEESVRSNCILPLRMLRRLLPFRNFMASAIFFSGTNPAKVNPGYSAYSASKAMLVRAVQEIDAELTNAKCFTLAPGFVRTKIHKVHDVSDRGEGTSHERIYQVMKHLLSRPKSEVGGKVFHVPTYEML